MSIAPLRGWPWAVLAMVLAGCGIGAPTPQPSPVAVDDGPTEATSPAESGQPEPLRAPDPLPEDLPPPRPAFDATLATERILLFTPRGPLLLAVEMAIDGQPYPLARRRLLEEMLETADADGNGTITWEEVTKNPRFAFSSMGESRPAGQRMDPAQRFDLNRNGLVERDEAALFISQAANSSGAFHFDLPSGPDGFDSRRSVLWELLDADNNGRLTNKELGAAGQVLARLDRDEDGLVRLADVRPDDQTPRRPAVGGGPVAVHLKDVSWDAIFYDLDERRYLPKFTAECFPIDLKLVGRLDANRNGVFDPPEAKQFAVIGPHVVMEANFGDSAERDPGLHVRSVVDSLGGRRKVVGSESDSLASLSFAGVNVRVVLRDAPKQDVQQRLASLDADKNGYLDEKEVGDSAAALGGSFADLDADGDGKVYPEELAALLRWRAAPAATRVRLSIGGAAQAIFSHLDGDGDRVLSPREVRSAAQRLRQMDVNNDGEVDQTEVTADFVLTLTRGEAAASGGPAGGNSPPRDVPRWFAAMDANNDGDLSQREFLGDAEQFKRLDVNRDGFIDEREAKDTDSAKTAPE